MPGSGYARRATLVGRTWPLLPLCNRRLETFLARAVALVRSRFSGEITYGAGSWDSVDWSRFDAVGINHYRDRRNRRSYVAVLERAVRSGRPVLVTEFGCCAFVGADDAGPEGDAVVDWSDPEAPRVRGEPRRDEAVQARYLGELLDVFVVNGVTGAFAFELIEPLYTRSDDPRSDLDLGSFGIVAVRAETSASGTVHLESPKAAFHELARRYAAY